MLYKIHGSVYMKKISAILPVYNVEKYIQKSLETIINQTHKNLEIILINDGSTDSSPKICEDYQKKDPRIKVIHKKNGGVSSAKNMGLSKATGDYIVFPDPDDWLELDMYENMLAKLQSHVVDIAVCDIYFANDDSAERISPKKAVKENTVLYHKDILLYLCDRENYANSFTYMHNKIFNHQTIKNTGVLFDEAIKRGEDRLFFVQLLLANKNITAVYVNKPYYYYYKRDGALTSKTDKKSIENMLKGLLKTIEALEKEGYNEYSDYIKELYHSRKNQYS